jgi:hypothetical protein
MHDNRDTFPGDTVLAINCEYVSAVQAYYDRRAGAPRIRHHQRAAVVSER